MAAWAVYAKELYHHGYGYPMWLPDPEPMSLKFDVEIADLGCIRDGQFIHLLRCKATQEELQPHQMQPETYAPFNPPNLVTSGPLENITQPMLCSRSMKNVGFQSGFSVNVESQAGYLSANDPRVASTPGSNFTFQCTQNKGALLLLSPRAEETYLRTTGHIITYMREHLDSWKDLAVRALPGFQPEREELFFVCGVTKTSRWGVAAFSGIERNTQVTVSYNFDSLISANMKIKIAGMRPPTSSWYRSGPSRIRESNTPYPSPAPIAVPYTPCRISLAPPTSVSTAAAASCLTMATAPAVMYSTIRHTHAASYSAFDCGSAESLESYLTRYSCPPIFQSSSTASSSDSSSTVNSGVDSASTTFAYISSGQESSVDTTPFARRSASGHPEKQDQCIFFHYYKAKRRRRRSNRLLPLKLVAGGGPNQLPRYPDGDLEAPKALVTVDGPAGSHLSGPSQHEEVYDPVNIVLDYILRNSNAKMAIASDMDLYALFPPDTFPDDIATALSRVHPPITVDEYGVGVLKTWHQNGML